METTRERMKCDTDKFTSANNFNLKRTLLQKETEQTQRTETFEVKKTNSPHTASPAMKNERSPTILTPGPTQFRRSTTRTPKRTHTVPTSVSSCSTWSPDVCSPLLNTVAKKEILNIPSAKRRALLGYNLPVINEQNYVSCPAIAKFRETLCVEDSDK